MARYRIRNTPNAERELHDLAKRIQTGDVVTVPTEKMRQLLKSLCRDKLIIVNLDSEE